MNSDIYKGVEQDKNGTPSPKGRKMSPAMSPTKKRRLRIKAENEATAAAFERRAKAIEARKRRMQEHRQKRERVVSNLEEIIDADRAARERLFLPPEEARQIDRYLEQNRTHRVPGIGVMPYLPDNFVPETDEQRAKAQEEQWEDSEILGKYGPHRAAKALLASIDNATGMSPMHWNAEIVGNRLIEAYRTLDMLPDTTAPARYKNSMPTVIRDEADRQGQEEERKKRDRERNRIQLTATSHQIFRMEEAFLWPIELLRKDKFRRIVFLWALWRARRKNLRDMCKIRKLDYSTFLRRKEIAVLAIAYELNKKKKPVHIGEISNLRARRRSHPRNTTSSTLKKTKVRAVIRGQVHDFS